jgi:hypothetical protein
MVSEWKQQFAGGLLFPFVVTHHSEDSGDLLQKIE